MLERRRISLQHAPCPPGICFRWGNAMPNTSLAYFCNKHRPPRTNRAKSSTRHTMHRSSSWNERRRIAPHNDTCTLSAPDCAYAGDASAAGGCAGCGCAGCGRATTVGAFDVARVLVDDGLAVPAALPAEPVTAVAPPPSPPCPRSSRRWRRARLAVLRLRVSRSNLLATHRLHLTPAASCSAAARARAARPPLHFLRRDGVHETQV